jgi:hypothetical protein
LTALRPVRSALHGPDRAQDRASPPVRRPFSARPRRTTPESPLTIPRTCRACGHPETDADQLVTVAIPHGPAQPVHESHTTDSRSGLYGAHSTTEGTNP